MDLSDVEDRNSLERAQQFDASKLARREELGRSFDFEEAVEPAGKAIEIFRQIPADLFPQISKEQQDHILSQAQSFLNLLEQITAFDPAADPNALANRQTLIDQVRGWESQSFNNLYQIIGYLATRQRDFSALERKAQAAIKDAEQEANKLRGQLATAEAEAQRVLAQVRATAAEMGVSQQAHHFGTEAESHGISAGDWQKYTVRTAIGLGTFAVLSLAVGKWFLVPQTPYESFQLAVSKVLIFATIGFMLILCSKTLTAHRHNRVVNKHRQNALLTFNALVDATEGPEAQNVVLTHASACIFAPQDSGFTKSQPAAHPLIELLPRLTSAPDGQQ